MRTRIGKVTILILGMLVAACDEEEAPFVPTPETSADARVISMVLSQAIRPDDTLADQIARELTAIRDEYGDEYPELVQLRVKPPWQENILILSMTESAGDSVRQGLYTAWDPLNEEQGATFQRISPSSPRARLQFDDLMHPRYMGEMYAELPGVIWAGPNMFFGDWPNVYPLQRESGRTYLFCDAGGDCPAGCTTYGYWYFRFFGGQTEFVGFWNPRNEPEPDWWTEAKENQDYLLDW